MPMSLAATGSTISLEFPFALIVLWILPAMPVTTMVLEFDCRRFGLSAGRRFGLRAL